VAPAADLADEVYGWMGCQPFDKACPEFIEGLRTARIAFGETD